MTAVLDVDIRHRFDAFLLDARFQSSGRLTALFGRSGSGKTSLVNVIGGLIRPDEGRVVVDGRPLVDTGQGLFTPKHKRRVGYVFQEARLFPHLTVRQNLLFGRWFSSRRRDTKADLQMALDILGIGHLLDRRPGVLSGGEKQRVAIGRALLSEPSLLLMDEPLASLDDARKAEILPHIERLRDEGGVPIVYVSHSVAEVARLSTVLVVMDQGAVTTVGPTAEVMSRLDAAVIGVGEAGSLLEAEIVGHDAQFALTLLSTPAGPLHVAAIARPIGARIRVRVFASDVLLSLKPLTGVSALNAFTGTVATIVARGASDPFVDVRLDCGGVALIARITARSAAELSLSQGKPIHAIIKSVSVEPLAGVAPEDR